MQDLEIIWVDVRLGTTNNLVAYCYRPPGQSAADIDSFLSGFELSLDPAFAVPNISYINQNSPIDTDVQYITDVLSKAMEECIPTKIITHRPRDKLGFTTRVRKLYRECQQLHNIKKRTTVCGLHLLCENPN